MHSSCLINPSSGPLLRVTLMVSHARQAALQEAGLPVPSPISANLLVDTGASCTSIDRHFVDAMKLQTTGSTPVHTPSTNGTAVLQDLFDIGILIEGNATTDGAPHVIQNLPVLSSYFRDQGIDGLLGRDVLGQCRMTYCGPDGLLLISF